MFNSYSFRALATLCFCLFLLACNEQENADKDLFTLQPKSRKALIKEGYKNVQYRLPVPDSSDVVRYRIDTLDNVFYKTVNDTVVKYVFDEEELENIEVGFRIKDMDAARFLNECKKRGFVQTNTIERSAQMAFIEPSQKIHYDVYWSKKYVSFVHFFKKPRTAVPPTVDTTNKPVSP